MTNSWPPISDLSAPPTPKKFMDQGIGPTHPHGQVYNATAPLREALRIRMGKPGQVGKAAAFTDGLLLGSGLLSGEGGL
ncbi:MAG TPA: hypothetical protein DEW46_13255 [Verrucomicrobia bacterium]|nr:hypothetical protein [Verrucomicrobiota bacterium]